MKNGSILQYQLFGCENSFIKIVISLCFILMVSCEKESIAEKKDTIPPALSINSPLPGKTVRGIVLIEARTDDDSEISLMEVTIHDSLHFSKRVPPFDFNWNTLGLYNKEYEIKIRSTDFSNNSTAKSVSVHLYNKPGDYYPVDIVKYQIFGFEVERPFIYLVAGVEGLWRKKYINADASWEYLGFAKKEGGSPMVDLSVNGDSLLAADNETHFWYSDDSGKNWKNTRLNNFGYLWDLERSPHDTKIIISIVEGKYLFKSIDNGRSWNMFFKTNARMGGLGQIFWHPYKKGEFWAMGFDGFNSKGIMAGFTNNGDELKSELDFKSDFYPEIKDALYMVFNSNNSEVFYTLAPRGEIYKTENGGLSWQLLINSNNFFSSIIEDPRYSDSYFLFGPSKIFYSKDGLKTIELIKTLASSIVTPLIEDDKIFYATAYGVEFLYLDNLINQ